MMEVIFNQSGAELRIQDGGANESTTMLENNISLKNLPQGVKHVQIMAHRRSYCQKPFTHAGCERHHERYTFWKRLENGHFPSSPAIT